jgi:hypothetical protein
MVFFTPGDTDRCYTRQLLLTGRERDVAVLAAADAPSREIAESLRGGRRPAQGAVLGERADKSR